MSWHRTDALGSVRESATEPRVIEGIALPYGIVSSETELTPGGPIVREAWAPASFAASVAHWMGRTDGARMAFRSKHGERPVGTVSHLQDTPEGVVFRAAIFDTPAGNDYLAEVRAGLNGVSIEAGLPPASRRMRDGTVLHREGKLHGIAGSTNPAYDGARIALRDMNEDQMPEIIDPAPVEPTPATAVVRDAATSAVEPIAPSVRAAAERSDPVVTAISSQVVITRPEAVYGPRSGESFIHDGWAATRGDAAASERQARHSLHLADVSRQIERAGDVLTTEIPGAYPNDYLPGLLTPRILKGRPMGGFFNRVPISDARPKIFAKVTTSTTAAVQSAEGANPAASDLATTAVTATPLLYGAETVVSRQVLDGGDPSATNMILADMIEAYAQASETVIKTAVEAGASASGTAITAATPFAGSLGNVIKYYTTRFKPAEAQFVPSALFAVLLAEADTTGRPKMPLLNPVNSDGTTAAGGVSGSILGATDYLSYASTVNVVVTARASDYVVYESSVAQFSYDAVTGPSAVRIGIWAYLVVGTRLGGLSVTAA